MTKRMSLLVMMLFLASFAQADEKALSVLTYQFKHKEAEKAATEIKTLVSTEGTVAIQPATNSVVITDHAENLKNISAALQRFDVAPQPVRLSVRLVTAARVEGAGRVPEAIKDVASKLALLRYNSFESIGSVDVSGREGEPGIVELGSGYRADFRFGEFDGTNSIPLADFKLAKLTDDQLTQIYKTTLNLKVGQTLIFGATRDPQSQRALIVIVSATRPSVP